MFRAHGVHLQHRLNSWAFRLFKKHAKNDDSAAIHYQTRPPAPPPHFFSHYIFNDIFTPICYLKYQTR